MNASKWIIFLFLIFLCSAMFAAASENGKIPITTSSEKAKSDFLKGRDLAEKLRIQDSVQYFQNAIKADPNFALAHLNLAFAQPNGRLFIEDVNKAVTLSDKASQGEKLWILGFQAGANGLPSKQGEYYENLAATYPNDERAHNLLGTYYFGLQQYDKAIQQYEKAVSINQDFTPAYNLLGYSYRFKEQFDKSEQAFRKYIDLIPNDPNPYDSYAELLMKTGRYDESIENYKKALQLDSNFVNSYVGISDNLNFKGDFQNARAELDKMLKVARTDGERRTAIFAKAVSYLNEGNHQSALQELDKQLALAKKMNDPAGIGGDLNTIGLVLLEKNQIKEAQSKFDDALKAVTSSNQSAEIKRIAERTHFYVSAQAALQSGDLKAAEWNQAELQKQAAAEKNNFAINLAHELAGRIAFQKKDYDGAIKELNQSNLQDPYNLYRLGLAYRAKNDEKNAQSMFQKAANFNGLNNLNYAFVRDKAKQALAK
jgi:tetratricopeptide (TPR) repeat protein